MWKRAAKWHCLRAEASLSASACRSQEHIAGGASVSARWCSMPKVVHIAVMAAPRRASHPVFPAATVSTVTGPPISRGPSKSRASPRGRIAAIDVSATVTVECAAVARSASSHLVCPADAAPQLTTIRCAPALNSNARHPGMRVRRENAPFGSAPHIEDAPASGRRPAADRPNAAQRRKAGRAPRRAREGPRSCAHRLRVRH